MEIQTEQYLEEISDRPVEKDMDTQTDPIADRPPSPLFVPAKSGEDKSTQIDPDLVFNFDLEVENILSVLVAKTLEQSLMEVREEEEVANMKKHQVTILISFLMGRRNLQHSELQNLQRLSKWRQKKEEKRKKKNDG